MAPRYKHATGKKIRATLNRKGSSSEKIRGYMEFYEGSKNGL
jgi:hypothetical protein